MLRPFRRDPFLNYSLSRLQLDVLPRDVSIPSCEFASDSPIAGCLATSKRRMLLRIDESLVNLCRLSRYSDLLPYRLFPDHSVHCSDLT